jgi:hypothetical protein
VEDSGIHRILISISFPLYGQGYLKKGIIESLRWFGRIYNLSHVNKNDLVTESTTDFVKIRIYSTDIQLVQRQNNS